MTFFILGSHPDLSIAEIFAVVAKKSVLAQTDDVLILDGVEENLEVLQKRLAGTIKIGHIFGEMSKWNQKETVALVTSFVSEAAGKNKISFGLSGYGMDQNLFTLGKAIKQELKATGRPVRFVSSNEQQLSSVIVQENNLLFSGGEFVFVKTDSNILIGQTQTVQDYKTWSKRDYGRPARNAKQGMLPPKLARLMINLSGSNASVSTLLDPFCGSGTVLMEGSLLGFKRLIGSDISEKAIQNTARNLTWLVDQFNLSPPLLTLHVSAAEKLDAVLKEQVDVIVTETFLGDPKTHTLSDREFLEMKATLLNTYEPSFKMLSHILKPNGVMVLAVPAFKTKKSFERLDIESLINRCGFQINQSFLYHRPDQIVAREIFVTTKI